MHCCDYTVGGTCRRQAGQFRVTVQLTNVGDGHLLWAEQFDLLAAVDNFTAEDTIVARICTAISQLLRPAVQATGVHALGHPCGACRWGERHPPLSRSYHPDRTNWRYGAFVVAVGPSSPG